MDGDELTPEFSDGTDQAIQLTAIPLFPTWLFSCDFPASHSLNADLRQLALEIRSRDPLGRTMSNRGGWQGDDQFHMNKTAAPLIHFIEVTMRAIKDFLNVNPKLEFYVASCWVNINGRGARNAVHIHGNSDFSGVYYVDAQAMSGDIEFKDPNSYLRQAHSLEYHVSNSKNCLEMRYPPVPGRLLIFPGYLPHEVFDNQNDEERISISFNVASKRSG